MRIRTKISLLTGGIFLGALLITSLSIWTTSEIERLRDTIERGTRLIASAQRLHGLMKDLMFDLFTPQTYRLLKDVLHTTRFQTARSDFSAAVAQFEQETMHFMESPDVKALLREEELRNAYQTAKTMIAKASGRIAAFDSAIDRLFEAGLASEGGLYRELQLGREPWVPPFFDQVRETSYYLTYSFESFLSHFIRSLRRESEVIRAQILIVFWTLTAAIGTATVSLSVAFARRISARIKSIEEGFRRVSLGDFSARLDVHSSDELGALASNFSLFMEDLKRNIDSILSLMKDVGQSLASRPTFERILSLIVEAAVKDSRATGAAVVVPGADGRPSVAKAAGLFPFAEGCTPPERAPSGSPAIGELFLRMEPVFCRGSCALGEGRVAGSLIALPLVVSQGPVGMLFLVTGEADCPLTDLDYNNFLAFAEHAGLVIDNFAKYRELMAKRDAEVRALRSQIQPHFLYNVLNAFIGLNRMGDSRALERAILSLKDMLRYILEQSDWATIEEEFSFAQRYCELQKMRFAERLAVRFSLDREVAEVRVPKLLLQPLVENAVIHGIEPLGRTGTLAVEARALRENGSLAVGITVEDDGVGFEGAPEGIGLANVRERLLLAYPGSRFVVASTPGRGTRVWITIADADGACEDSTGR